MRGPLRGGLRASVSLPHRRRADRSGPRPPAPRFDLPPGPAPYVALHARRTGQPAAPCSVHRHSLTSLGTARPQTPEPAARARRRFAVSARPAGAGAPRTSCASRGRGVARPSIQPPARRREGLYSRPTVTASTVDGHGLDGHGPAGRREGLYSRPSTVLSKVNRHNFRGPEWDIPIDQKLVC